MCGIMGCILGQRERSELELEEIRDTISDVLVAAQVRGTDAAGAFVVNPTSLNSTFDDGSPIGVLRESGPAEDLVQSDDWWDLMDTVTESTTAVIGHTRFATVG